MNSRSYIIAEAGVNHNGSLELAKKLVDVASKAGVDAVKFQTFKANLLASKSAPKALYQTKNTKKTETQFDMLKKLELDYEAHVTLNEYCKFKKIEFLSTPFDLESVDELTSLGVKSFKIGSGDITNAPLLLKVSETGKPIILSTGMSTLREIEEALSVIAFGYLNRKTKPSLKNFVKAYISEQSQVLLEKNVILLHCTTEYPAPVEEVNLNCINTLKSSFGLNVGYSDHTEGYEVVLAAVALGAKVIEKHFTLDKKMDGPDHKASLEPIELINMVKAIRNIENAMGSSVKKPTKSELQNINVARKSIVANVKINKNEIFTEENISFKRPGGGISPMNFTEILGKKATKSYLPDEKI